MFSTSPVSFVAKVTQNRREDHGKHREEHYVYCREDADNQNHFIIKFAHRVHCSACCRLSEKCNTITYSPDTIRTILIDINEGGVVFEILSISTLIFEMTINSKY